MSFQVLIIVGVMLSIVWFMCGLYFGFYSKTDKDQIGSLLIIDDKEDGSRYLMLEFISEDAKNSLHDGDVVSLQVEAINRE